MILDERNEFCDATALNTGGAAIYNVGDVIDLGLDGMDLGAGEDIYCVIQVDTTATSGGSATGAFALVSDDVSTPNTSTATKHFITSAIPVATLVAGYQIAAFRLPAGTYERYLGIQQTTATAAFTAGRINAFLTKDIAAWKAYADAI